MISKLKIIILKRIFPVIFALLLAFAVLLSDYVKAYATDLPVDGSWSGYDIIYTLLQSIGITISFDSGNSDGMPPGYDKESYDEFMSEAESLALQAQDNIETGDTPIQELMDELKSLPENIKDGCITISQDLWNYLNTYIYEDIAASVEYAGYVDEYAPVDSSFPYRYYSHFSENGTVKFQYAFATSAPVTVFYYDVVSPDGTYEQYQFGSAYSSEDFNVLLPDGRTIDPGYYNGFYFFSSGCIGGYSYLSDYFGKFSIYGASRLSLWEYGWTFKNYVDNVLSGGVAVELAPDVIWPDTDLSYDIVNHVTTWDESIANDLITTAEDDDTVAVIPLVDTGVGEDVYENVADVVIPGVGEGESEASSEGASEAESEKADELVDSDVISSLPGTAAEAGDITKLFPFCIPFDIVSMVKGMQASEKAPVWHFKYYFKTIDYTFEFTVDMTDYEKYIKIFRAGIVIFYVITLMLITIRYSSGIVRD